VSDFQELNKLIKCKPFPLPIIQDIMNRRGKYKYFTKIDLSMFFYSLELDDKSKELCTIHTPYGLYRYRHCVMGVKVSPDAAQGLITKVLAGIDCAACMDDCGIWTDRLFQEHMELVGKVLERLADNGLKCNPLKCDWAVQETDFLGYWMTPNNIRPMKKKIDVILRMDRPTNRTQARSFIRAVNRIPVMAPILAPLLGILFLRGHISLKNWTYSPLLRGSASPFKSTCLLIRLKEVPAALNGTYLWW
jgi:hypothetical protein